VKIIAILKSSEQDGHDFSVVNDVGEFETVQQLCERLLVLHQARPFTMYAASLELRVVKPKEDEA